MNKFAGYFLLTVLIAVQSCQSNDDPKEKAETVFEFIEELDEEGMADSWERAAQDYANEVEKVVEEKKNDPNYEIICAYCYSITEEGLEACDSCGLAPKIGPYLLSHEDLHLQTVNTTICTSCWQIIPEVVTACKYCMGIQPKD